MPNAPRLRPGPVGVLALAVVFASLTIASVPGQSILFEPGSVNASVSAQDWWLANGSIVATWSVARGGFRLASIYDRLGGRAAPRTGEAFMFVFADGRVVRGSEMRAAGPAVVETLPPAAASPRADERVPGKALVARFETGDGALAVSWRGSLREGADHVRQEVTIDAARGPAPVEVVLVDAQDAGARPGTTGQGPVAFGRASFLAVEDARAHCAVQETQIRCALAVAGDRHPFVASSLIGLAAPARLSAATAESGGADLLDRLLSRAPPEADRGSSDLRLIAGPYLQAPGETSMTVMWVTDRAAAGWVEYGTDGRFGLRALAISDGLVDADTRVHRVTIRGLEPDTVYRYRIAARAIDTFGPYKVDYTAITRSGESAFRTLGPSRARYSFLVLNDLHEDVDVLRRHAVRAGAEPYDLVFFNGDTLSHLESEAQILERCLVPASELFAGRVPFVLVRGNHETRGRYARQLKNYLALPGGRYYYAFDHGPVHFVVMDTGEDKEDTHWAYSGLTDFDGYREAEAAWLAAEVRTPAFRNAPFRVLIAHMPFFGNQGTRVDGYGQRSARERWGALLNDAGIDLHIAGHTHRANWVDRSPDANRFPVLVGGGSQPGTNTLTRVAVSPDRLDITVTTDDGKEIGRYSVPRREAGRAKPGV